MWCKVVVFFVKKKAAYEFGFFFFKQKTAYEIRNCDWSSDVCSSDLGKRKKGKERGKEREKRKMAGMNYEGNVGKGKKETDRKSVV